ncbi:MAG TPA: hypothetical protein VJP45_01910, partial [Candidatus Limnocylindria bacterium]|nr:hypothetical protein [Candidatus Limnocylindria bacterium]
MAKETRYCDLAVGDVYMHDGRGPFAVDMTSPTLVHPVTRLGKGKPVKIPGLAHGYRPVLWRGRLIVGCQRINALAAFKALGAALGYEV